MKIERIKEHVESYLGENEILHGWFMGQYYNLILILCIGPLAWLTLRSYFFAVTDKGVHIHRLGLLDKFEYSDFFTYDEILSLSIKKGTIQNPVKFTFDSGRTLQIRALSKGSKALPKLTPELQEILESRIGGLQ